MGAFSIWHWIIVLFVLGIYVAPVFLARRQKYLERRDYIWRTGSVLIAMIALAIGSSLLQDRAAASARQIANMSSEQVLNSVEGRAAMEAAGNASLVALAVWVVSLVLLILLTLWSVHRLQDLGWSRWIALLMVVPGVNLVLVIVLMAAPRRRRAA